MGSVLIFCASIKISTDKKASLRDRRRENNTAPNKKYNVSNHINLKTSLQLKAPNIKVWCKCRGKF